VNTRGAGPRRRTPWHFSDASGPTVANGIGRSHNSDGNMQASVISRRVADAPHRCNVTASPRQPPYNDIVMIWAELMGCTW